MKAILIKGMLCEWAEIENRKAVLEYAVGGHIRTVSLPHGAVMLTDEDASFKDKPGNLIASLIAGTEILGLALILGEDGEEFCDVPEYFHDVMQLPELFGK